MNKKISVIVPCYNAKKYILDTLNTVQVHDECIGEIIVIDDASTDGSYEYVQNLDFPKLVLHQLDHNQGISAARNYGIERVKYPYVAFLDADDLWPAGRSQALMHAMDEQNAQWAFGYIEHFLSEDYEGDATFSKPPIQIGYFASAMLVKTDFMNRVGFFDVSLKLGEFIDWYDRARILDPKPAIWHQLSLRRRMHGTNTSILTNNDKVIGYLHAARNAINRKKNAQ